MLDEEKEAIEILRGFEPDDLVECAIYLRALEKITNLIEKQSKEIQSLEAKKYMYNADTGEISQIPLNDNYINKDKIKAKIEELKKDIQYSVNPLSIDNSKFGIKILQSLLEKE